MENVKLKRIMDQAYNEAEREYSEEVLLQSQLSNVSQLNSPKLDNTYLKTPCIPFDFSDPPIDPIDISKYMVKTMYELDGLGLAANQVGMHHAFFAFRGDPENFVAFNPKIVHYSEELIELEEGCLSFPGIIVRITRPRHCRVRFQMPNGETKTMQLTGISARVFQHEYDHILGKTFKDRVSKLKLDIAIRKANKRGYKYTTMDF
jgi:peptide deformylase